MKVCDQVSHGLGFDLEAGHWGGVAADDLMNEFGVILPVGHARKSRSNQSLTSQAMATYTVDLEKLTPVIPCTLEFKTGFDIGIPLRGVQRPDREDYARCRSNHHDSCHQTANAIRLFSCSW